jgi:small nuclear ribonucleoprotein (snRNP)-like protein
MSLRELTISDFVENSMNSYVYIITKDDISFKGILKEFVNGELILDDETCIDKEDIKNITKEEIH